MSNRTLLTVREVAARLRTSEKTVYRRVRAGEIPGLKLGSTVKAPVRVDRRELEAWLYDEEGATDGA